jgi:hypothetical protein
MHRSTRSLARAATAVAALIAIGAPAASVGASGSAPPRPVEVLASGLEGPFGLQAGRSHLYVAESGAGQITEIRPWSGRTNVVASGLMSPSGVDRVHGVLAIVTGGAEEPDPNVTGDASLFVARRGGRPRLLADLEAYELAHNPDGQLQFDPQTGEPLDALSNPFAVIGKHGRGFVLVADAGANAVLMVTRTGRVSTFFVPPLVNKGACKGRPNNDPDHVGCDPVPTGLAYGPGNKLYVSTLSGEAPRQGRVYVLNARTGRSSTSSVGSRRRRASPWRGTARCSSPRCCTTPPRANRRPASIPPRSGGSYASHQMGHGPGVTMPLGLVVHRGKLYSTAWSVAGFLGIEDAEQVVKVRRIAFR